MAHFPDTGTDVGEGAAVGPTGVDVAVAAGIALGVDVAVAAGIALGVDVAAGCVVTRVRQSL